MNHADLWLTPTVHSNGSMMASAIGQDRERRRQDRQSAAIEALDTVRCHVASAKALLAFYRSRTHRIELHEQAKG
jgi:hypothetical protein